MEEQLNHNLIEFLDALCHAGMERHEVLRLGYEFATAELYTQDDDMRETENMARAAAMLARAVKARNELAVLSEAR